MTEIELLSSLNGQGCISAGKRKSGNMTENNASSFPETSLTLLGKLAAQVTGEDQSNWMRFWNLYAGVIRRFAVRVSDENHADDILSEVMRKLVDVFRAGSFTKDKGNFRAYLAQMVRNEVGMAYRKERARRMDRRVYLDDDRSAALGGLGDGRREKLDAEMAVSGEIVPEDIDLAWAAAKRTELEDHLLANPSIKPVYREAMRYFWREGCSLDEVVEALKMPRNTVTQIKCRMEKALLALAAEIGD